MVGRGAGSCVWRDWIAGDHGSLGRVFPEPAARGCSDTRGSGECRVRADGARGQETVTVSDTNPAGGSREAEAPSGMKAPWRIFWIALLIRLAYMTFAHMWHMRPYEDHFAFGYEMGRIGRALMTGYGFAEPFRGHTGPTAWVPPLYPWILAGDFWLFGVYTPLAAWMVLAFDCVLNALMVCTTWEIAARCFNRKVALWSAWLWALYPATMQYAVKWVWEMTLTAFLFSWVLVLALRMRRIGEREGAARA